METYYNKNTTPFYLKSFLFISMIFLGFFFFANDSFAYGNNIPLETIIPKEAGTGDPAINSAHRIFRAYPGLEYNIRAAVIGGSYPYVFSLSAEPEGMTINSKTGEISWPDPQENAGPITLKVTDSEGDSVTTSWSINVTTSGFIFVDESYGGTGMGSIDQPYNSIQDLIDLSGHESDIVYFRAGTYTVPIYHPIISTGMGCNLAYIPDPKPHMWLAYPGEAVTIDMDDHVIEEMSATLNPSYYFDDLTFTNMTEYGFRITSGNTYLVFRRCNFNDFISTRTTNENMGCVFFPRSGDGKYNVFQGSKFHDITDGQGIGSLYNQDKMLVEDCEIYDLTHADWMMPPSAIAPKSHVTNSTFRHNKISVTSGYTIGGGNGIFAAGSDNNEICFNYLYAGDGSAIKLNGYYPYGATYYYRNTIIGSITLTYINAEEYENGPLFIENNIIVSPEKDGIIWHYTCGPNPENYVTIEGSQTSTLATDFVDSNGSLQGKYTSLVGTVGWEIAEDEYWSGEGDAIAPTAPSGLSVS